MLADTTRLVLSVFVTAIADYLCQVARFREDRLDHGKIAGVEREAKDTTILGDMLRCAEPRADDDASHRRTVQNVADTDIGDTHPMFVGRLSQDRKQFLEQYTQTGTDGELILKRTEEAGCVFLDGNDCTIYDFRPKTCEGFPHLLKGMGSIQHKMWAYVDRATYCPIVYNWMEQVKDLTNFKK